MCPPFAVQISTGPCTPCGVCTAPRRCARFSGPGTGRRPRRPEPPPRGPCPGPGAPAARCRRGPGPCAARTRHPRRAGRGGVGCGWNPRPGVHRFGHPPRVDQPEAAGRSVGQQEKHRPVPRGDLLHVDRLDNGQHAVLPHRLADQVPADPARRVAVGNPQAPGGDDDVGAVPCACRREHPLVGPEPRREAVGQAVAPEQATKSVAERGHRLPAIGSVTRPPPSPSRAGRSGTARAARGRRTAPGRRRRRPPGSSAAAAT